MRRVLFASMLVVAFAAFGCGKQGAGERCDQANTPAGGSGLGGDCEDNLKCTTGGVCCDPADLNCAKQTSDTGVSDADEAGTETGGTDTGGTDTGSADTGKAEAATDATEAGSDADAAGDAADSSGGDAAADG